jgi:hypothetical protein
VAGGLFFLDVGAFVLVVVWIYRIERGAAGGAEHGLLGMRKDGAGPAVGQTSALRGRAGSGRSKVPSRAPRWRNLSRGELAGDD